MGFEADPELALYAAALRHYRLTPTQFAALDPSDQSFILGYELYRRRQMHEWRQTLIGDGDPKDSKLTAESATMLRIEGL